MTTLNSTIGTSAAANAWAFGDPYQKYAFYALGRFWVFYSDGTNGVWRTSTDGTTWSAATTVRACTQGYRFSITFDGTNVHYVYGSLQAGDDINYRMGAIASDGTISWLAAEQTAVAIDVDHRVDDPAIEVDTNGFPWIAYVVETIATDETLAYVAKSSTKNGTWTNEAVLFTSPYQFSASIFEKAAAPHAWATVVALSGGQMYAIAQPGLSPLGGTEVNIKGRLWDGSAWDSEETVATPVDAILSGHICPVVDSHDNIILVYIDYDAVGDARTGYFTIRTASTGLWGTPAIMRAPTTAGVAGYTVIDTNDIIYHFYETDPTVKHIYYKRYANGAWEAVTDWITETQAFSDEYTSFAGTAVKGALGRIIFVYVTLTVSPRDVKMAALEILNTRGWAM